jgi:hypothetical protein
MRRELLLGCGSNRTKKLAYGGRSEWSGLLTLDMNADHAPDIVHDLGDTALPVEHDSCDEIHAYDVLEHVGRQGDWQFFFAQWTAFWQALKPGGLFMGISPHPTSPWAWGDPGHTRVICPESFVFLSQPAYTAQIGVTPMTDYRFCYRADFDLIHSLHHKESGQHEFVLQAVKPSRIAS